MTYAYSIRICRIKVLLDLFFGGRLNTNGVGELDSVVAMSVVVVAINVEYVHHLAPADKVVDVVFDLLW